MEERICREAGVYRNQRDNSSIGPKGYIGPVSSDRLKGFLRFSVDGNKRLDQLQGILRHGIALLQEGRFSDRSRLSVRFVAPTKCEEDIEKGVREVGALIEAKLPLDLQASGNSIYYVAFNKEARRQSAEERSAYITQIKQSYAQKISAEELCLRIDGTAEKRYSIHIFNGDDVPLHHMTGIVRLLGSKYGYSSEEALSIVGKHTNKIAVAAYNTVRGAVEVAGISMIERSEIRVNGRRIRLAEITETAVAKGHVGNNLHLAMTTFLMAHMPSPDNYLLFSESTLAHSTVIHSCAAQGRIYSGILENHVEIEGKLTSLAVMHVPAAAHSHLINILRK